MILFVIYMVGIVMVYFGSVVFTPKYLQNDLTDHAIIFFFCLLWPLALPFVLMGLLRREFYNYLVRYKERKEKREKQLAKHKEERAQRLREGWVEHKIEPTFYPPTPQAPSKQLSAGGYRDMPCKECGNSVKKEVGI
jgi:predicted membrane protein